MLTVQLLTPGASAGSVRVNPMGARDAPPKLSVAGEVYPAFCVVMTTLTPMPRIMSVLIVHDGATEGLVATSGRLTMLNEPSSEGGGFVANSSTSAGRS